MKTKRKQFIAVILSGMMIFSTTGFAFADTEEETTQTEPVKIEKEVGQPTTVVEQPKQEETQKEEIKNEEPQKEEVKLKAATLTTEQLQKNEITKEEEPVIEEESKRKEQTPNADNSVTLHYTNSLSILKQHQDENGRPEPYETQVVLKNNQTKTQSAKGVLSYFGGKDYSFTYGGVTYTFLNVVTEVDENTTTPIYWETTEDGKTIAKIGNKNSNITYTYNNSSETEVVLSRSDIYVAPVYSQKQNWFLEYNYIDNISTGSGSWSNLDAITQYKHTFSNPENKSPSITEGKYQFRYWKNETTGEEYGDGDSFIYSGLNAYHENGYKEIVNTYAYWQPAVVVNLYNGNELVKTISSFESISSSEFEKLADTDTQKFVGWLDENGMISDIYYAPGITKEEGYLVINLTAQFEDIVIPVPTPDPEPPVVTPDKPDPKVVTKTKTNDTIVYYGMGDGEPTVKTPTIIKKNPLPLSLPQQAYWALLNLILAIATCVLAFILIIFGILNKREEDEDTKIKNKWGARIASICIGVLSLIVFFITENMNNPWTWIDGWTWLMIVILAVQIVCMFVAKHKEEENEETL